MAFREYCAGCESYGECFCGAEPEVIEARNARKRAEKDAKDEALREEGRQQERAAVLNYLSHRNAFLAQCGADTAADEAWASRGIIERGEHLTEGK